MFSLNVKPTYKVYTGSIYEVSKVPELLTRLCTEIQNDGFKVVSHTCHHDYHSPDTVYVSVIAEKQG